MSNVVIQSEPRWEAIGADGEFAVYEVDEGGAVLTTAYFADHDDAVEQAQALAGTDGKVQDDTKTTKAKETK